MKSLIGEGIGANDSRGFADSSIRGGAVIMIGLFVASWLAAQVSAPPRIDDAAVQRFRNDVTTLASDKMEGRGLGTKGIERAADFIEARLRSIGLKPAFGPSYRQPFQVKT